MHRSVILILTIVMSMTACLWAGSLNPPAPPTGGTMKPLDQVEPRTPITSVPYTISASGSYYLAKNLTSTGHGILIYADDVTIDLCGFTLTGPGAGSNYGVYMSGRRDVEIRNGAIRSFTYGISDSASNGKNHRVIGVRLTACLSQGIYFSGTNHVVRDCIVTDTTNTTAGGTFYGIYILNGMITDCMVTGTGNSAVTGSTVYGIATSGAIISRNRVYGNGSSAAGSVYAIDGGYASTISDNTVCGNGGSAAGTVLGINTNIGCTITNNTVYVNGQLAAGTIYGLYAGIGSTVSGNSVYSNGASATGSYVYGIAALSGTSVIGNTVRSNGSSASGTVYGIWLGGYNLVNNNTAFSNAGSAGGTNMNTSATCTYGTNCAP